MGKFLVINGADFSANGIPVVDKLALIKSAMEAAYYEHVRFTTSTSTGVPTTASANRNAWGMIVATGFPSFVVTPKQGFHQVPIQTDGNTGKFAFEWTDYGVTYEGFDSKQYVGGNLAYGGNQNLPDGLSLWDMVEVTLAE